MGRRHSNARRALHPSDMTELRSGTLVTGRSEPRKES